MGRPRHGASRFNVEACHFLLGGFNQIWRIPRKASTTLILRFDLAQLCQSTPWRACHLTFRAAPGCNAETDADQKCNPAADATP
jgi:hypothetical protein